MVAMALNFSIFVILIPRILGVSMQLPFTVGVAFFNAALLLTWWLCIFQSLSATAQELTHQYLVNLILLKKVD